VQLKTSALADERKNALEMSVDQDPEAPSTLFLKPSPSANAKASVPTEGLTLVLRDGTIDSTAIAEPSLSAFLGLLGKEDHDAVKIDVPAKTADDSNALKVRAVQDMNSNLAYEFLLRKGVPAYRIQALSHETAQSEGVESGTKDADALRMQWKKDPSVAALAEKEMAAVSPNAAEELLTDSDWQIPIPADPQPGEEPLAQLPAEEEEQAATKSETKKTVKSAKAQRGFASSFDLLTFLDYVMPGGELKDHAKAGSWFGLGVSTNLKTTGIYEIRGNLLASFNASLKAKEADRSGDLHLHYQALRFDFLWGKAHSFRPYLSLALASYTSKADIDRPSTSVRNSRSHNDFGTAYTAGYECPVASQFFVSPELTYHRVGGDFDESLLSLGLSLRYRI
jgi:opacity protein-like surface antigen